MADCALNPAASKRRKALARAFAAARPFRHVVIDDFLTAACCARLVADFPPYDKERFLSAGGKAAHPDVRALSPAYRELDELVRSRPFLKLISAITGIPRLLHDPSYHGGGTHEILHGMDNSTHLDFNRHRDTGWYRRVNVFIYLNPAWRKEWGGALELHSRPLPPGRDRVKSIIPALNRCVIFETSEMSWHGVSRVSLPPRKRRLSRRSFALYLYSKSAPDGRRLAPRGTIYTRNELAGRLTAGHRLTAAELDALRQWAPSTGSLSAGVVIARPVLPASLRAGRVLTDGDIRELRRAAGIGALASELLLQRFGRGAGR